MWEQLDFINLFWGRGRTRNVNTYYKEQERQAVSLLLLQIFYNICIATSDLSRSFDFFRSDLVFDSSTGFL